MTPREALYAARVGGITEAKADTIHAAWHWDDNTIQFAIHHNSDCAKCWDAELARESNTMARQGDTLATLRMVGVGTPEHKAAIAAYVGAYRAGSRWQEQARLSEMIAAEREDRATVHRRRLRLHVHEWAALLPRRRRTRLRRL